MIQIIYLIILVYFILGGIGFYLINRHKSTEVMRKSYTKFGMYFIIINILFFSIVIHSLAFRYISIVIIGIGFVELIKLYKESGFKRRVFFLFSILAYTVLALGFCLYSSFEKELILFSFLVLSIFDSFSQITGQLWGRTKILPTISPNKTLAGLIGGIVTSLISVILLKKLFVGSIAELIIYAIGLAFFAFAGDMLASLYKRKYNVKDYSNLIPGHGGFLDRFDSLIAGGAWTTLYLQFIVN